MNTNSGSFCSLASATPLRLIVLVALCIAVAGCKRDEENVTGMLSKTGPDEHGVVCYTLGHMAVLSCVKVR
jgi:hypothetical protein